MLGEQLWHGCGSGVVYGGTAGSPGGERMTRKEPIIRRLGTVPQPPSFIARRPRSDACQSKDDVLPRNLIRAGESHWTRALRRWKTQLIIHDAGAVLDSGAALGRGRASAGRESCLPMLLSSPISPSAHPS